MSFKRYASEEYVDSRLAGIGENLAFDSVLYTEQSLTDEQKEQARVNIGAASTNVIAIDGGATTLLSDVFGGPPYTIEFTEDTENVTASNIAYDSKNSGINANNIQESIDILANEKVTKPTTAQIGQVIAVKTVDENNKPTEWEAINISGGSGYILTDADKQEIASLINVSNGGSSGTTDLSNYYTKTEVNNALSNKLNVSELQTAINDALAQAKASGDFDGKDGSDYVLTGADKAELVNNVLASLPIWSGGAY